MNQEFMNYQEHYRQDALVFDYFDAGQLSPGELRRNRFIIDYCDIKPSMEIMDVGSGRGWFSLAASAKGAKVTALDLSEHNLKRIKELDPRIDTVLGDACQIPPGDRLYDLIVALEVLEHIPEPALALASLKLRLKPGGKLIITVPYKEVIRSSLCIHCNQLTPQNAHLHSFDTLSMTKLLAESGFRAIETRLFTHKLMTVLRFYELTAKLPYVIWYVLDRCLGLYNDKYHYLAVKASPE
ncbi:Ubiquinone biosynthesis O-methyltransferase [anaerobic digester metagenome]|jgi:2-polyprenyl-3-methyl-5-hydroxy-6-metoxy-1,4-benzoquinol methylase